MLRFDVVDARAERVLDAELQHVQRAAAETPTTPGALSRTLQADCMLVMGACVAAQRDTTSRLTGAAGVQICGTGDLPERS